MEEKTETEEEEVVLVRHPWAVDEEGKLCVCLRVCICVCACVIASFKTIYEPTHWPFLFEVCKRLLYSLLIMY